MLDVQFMDNTLKVHDSEETRRDGRTRNEGKADDPDQRRRVVDRRCRKAGR